MTEIPSEWPSARRARTSAAATVTRRTRVGGRLGAVALPLLGLVVAITVWWLITSVLELVHPVVLPPPQR